MLNWLMTATPDGATRGQVLVIALLYLIMLPWFASLIGAVVRECMAPTVDEWRAAMAALAGKINVKPSDQTLAALKRMYDGGDRTRELFDKIMMEVGL